MPKLNRDPDRVFASATWYNVPVKKVKREDRIAVAGLQLTVLRNKKNRSGGRVLTCMRGTKPSTVTLILHKNDRLTVNNTISESSGKPPTK